MQTTPGAYYAVIFSSQLSSDTAGYDEAAVSMERLARQSDGFLGIESARNADGFGLTVSYWQDEASIQAWKQNLAHLQAQQTGKTRWYSQYTLRVCKFERGYAHPEADNTLSGP